MMSDKEIAILFFALTVLLLIGIMLLVAIRADCPR